MSDYISEVFGDGGLFASRFPGYEMREGQVALARMVDDAMRGGRHAIGEGPCGPGKSGGEPRAPGAARPQGPADARERAAVAVHVRAAQGTQQLRLPRSRRRVRG